MDRHQFCLKYVNEGILFSSHYKSEILRVWHLIIITIYQSKINHLFFFLNEQTIVCFLEFLMCTNKNQILNYLFRIHFLFISDLAVLLRGKSKSTSRIEFGAHQAVLVANDAARDNLPDALRQGIVLTIYEAKGLEFDDILLYNFFKDSQVN